MFLLGKLALAPLRGLMEIVARINEEARREISDPELLRNRLLQLQLAYELGEIGEEEYQAAYSKLMERLQELSR